MDQPLVSILTPVYNGEAFLVECIESVLSQTYRNWEYVIVNN
jgi:glycosyltransferase involved in cell wall biosynthesis